VYLSEKGENMTWNVNINGHDNLTGEEKEQFEKGLVDEMKALVDRLKTTEGVVVSSGMTTTNTTGSVNLL